MDKELIAYFDERFARLEERDERNQAETNRRLEKVEEAIHLTQVTVESLRGDIRLMAEGLMGFSDTMDKRSAEVDRKLDDLKASIAPVYRSLEKKVDAQYEELGRRIVVLEERAARENRDIMDVIREKYGRTQKTA